MDLIDLIDQHRNAPLCRFCGGLDGPDHPRRCDGRQGHVEAVNAARDAALAQVATHAERDVPGFLDAAELFVLQYLVQHGPTAGEVLTLQCKQAGIVPHDDRAFGPVYMRLVRRGAIIKAGAVRRERGHGTAGGHIWEYADRGQN